MFIADEVFTERAWCISAYQS